MYGDLGTKLVLSAQRANNLDKIPLFENEIVQSIINESNDLQKQIDGISNEPILTNQSNNTNISAFNSSVMNTPRKSAADTSFFSSSVNNTPGNNDNNSNKKNNKSAEVQHVLDNLPEFVKDMFIARNKRCLFAYEMSRIRKLDEMVWDNIELSSEQLADLSHNERVYLEKYTSLVSGMKGVMPDVDLGGSLEPPSDVFIDVRVLKDAGEIMTEYGVFNLTKDSQFFVRKVDVERLIQQGYLKQI